MLLWEQAAVMKMEQYMKGSGGTLTLDSGGRKSGFGNTFFLCHLTLTFLSLCCHVMFLWHLFLTFALCFHF